MSDQSPDPTTREDVVALSSPHDGRGRNAHGETTERYHIPLPGKRVTTRQAV